MWRKIRVKGEEKMTCRFHEAKKKKGGREEIIV